MGEIQYNQKFCTTLYITDHNSRLSYDVTVLSTSAIPLPVKDSLQLECSNVNRNEALQWIRTDGRNISEFAIGVNYAFLVIPSSELSDLGHYTCLLITENGFTASTNVVDVSGGEHSICVHTCTLYKCT